MSTQLQGAERFTAWAAILGGVFAYLNIILMVALTGGDMALTMQGGWMLGLNQFDRELFRLSMFADVLGFYLPVLAIGGYLWNRFRASAGVMGDIGMMAITVYVMLGLAGASLQLAALSPLTSLHLAGDASVKAGAEAAWTAIAVGSQRGLWWCEGPVVLLWGAVVGAQMKREGWGGAMTIPLTVVGWAFMLFFLTGLFPVLEPLTYLCLVVAVAVFPMWMLMFGLRMRKHVRARTSCCA